MTGDLFWRVSMRKQRIYFEIFYLLLIGATFGAVMVLGILVAPVIFNSEMLLEQALLDHYNEGVIMAEVFRRFTYWGYSMVVVIVLFEMYEYKQLRFDAITLASAATVIGTLLLFSAVYTPKILQMQSEGIAATLSEDFANIHAASEIDFKILALALIVLFVRRVMLLRMIKG